MRAALAGCVALAALAAGCGGGGEGTPAGGAPSTAGAWFRVAGPECGVEFAHVRAHVDRFWIPETVTGGAALFDADGDGRLDLYLAQGGDPLEDEAAPEHDRFFRNLGGGRFEDATAAAGLGHRGYGFGCATGDYDADGDLDLYVCNLGADVLYRNEGDGTFTDVTESAGVLRKDWSSCAAFLDHDGDGDLDLFVVHYLNWTPESEVDCRSNYGERDYCNPVNYNAPTHDTLFRNEGDGTFVEVTRQAGLVEASGTGLGIAGADFDGDGAVDVYVTNDGMPNHLWINDGDGTFTERALLFGCAVNRDGSPEAGMGVQAVDVEHDGDWDLFMTHVREQTNTFYSFSGGGFADVTSRVGLGASSVQYTGFGLGFHDFDHDGLLDLYVANGRVGMWRPFFSEEDRYAEPNQLFRGLPGARFEELAQGPTDVPLLFTSRTAAFGDLDDDGDVDVVQVEANAPVHVLWNEAPKQGGWLGLRLLDARGADALGAVARLETPGGPLIRLCQTAYSYGAANDPRVHFGLPRGVTRADLVVTWPGGAQERFGPLAAGAYHTVRAGTGEAAE